MVGGSKDFRALSPVFSAAIAMMLSSVASAFGAEAVLYSFQGSTDGIGPAGILTAGTSDNLYGTTVGGGGGTECRNSIGCGTVFQIAPDGTETVLYAFAGGCDGGEPDGGLVTDKSGNMYGSTAIGGMCGSNEGFGTVYKLTPTSSESVLYAFQGGSDGQYPFGNLVLDAAGNLYGVAGGGDLAACQGLGCGIVFEVTPEGQKSVLYTFEGGSDGAAPYGGLIRNKAGNLFGTTSGGGGATACGGYGCGTVFKVAPDGTETILHAFQGGSDGELPESGLVADSAGSLYGTTTFGGSGAGEGTVFKVTPDGVETVLYSFQGGIDGATPESALIMDNRSNLYGTTWNGGSTRCHGPGCGTVFKLAPDGSETVLVAFGGHRGVNPAAGLFQGRHGFLYGTTTAGGSSNDGVVFSVKR